MKRKTGPAPRVRMTLEEESVCMLGLGYVGLTLGVTLAELGIKVFGVDTNPALLKMIRQGKSHFYEKGLDALLNRTIGRNFTVGPKIPAGKKYNIYIVSVGTPLHTDKTPNLSSVEGSAATIAPHLKAGDLVILRSTVPVGTTRKVVLPLLEKGSGLKAGRDFSLVFAPERTVEGNALRELRELPQIIGGLDERSFIRASMLFRQTTPTILKVSTIESAEMVKIMDNTYRDMHFAISNELALICEKLDLNAVECIRAANMGYNRTNIPVPSPGVAGACLSKDPYILSDVAHKSGYDSRFVRLAREINEFMPVHVADRVRQFLETRRKGGKAKIFILGFAFKAKPVTSDTRNSPTMPLVQELKKMNAALYGYDPSVLPAVIREEFGVTPCGLAQGFRNADAVIMMLNHEQYREMDIYGLLRSMKRPGLFYDGWQMFNTHDIQQVEGILHEGVGLVS